MLSGSTGLLALVSNSLRLDFSRGSLFQHRRWSLLALPASSECSGSWAVFMSMSFGLDLFGGLNLLGLNLFWA